MNDFRSDDTWQREKRDQLLIPFYEKRFENFICLDPDESRGEDCILAIQKELGVDTLVVARPGEAPVGIEEKIVRWPKAKGEAHTAYALETTSCTLPGRESEGWMFYSAADTLLYAFEQEDGSLLIDMIAMRPLKRWFFSEMPERSRTSDPYYRFKNYARHRMSNRNQSEVRVVPIKDVHQALGEKNIMRVHMPSGKKIPLSRLTTPLVV
jgi:hypothetical protein